MKNKEQKINLLLGAVLLVAALFFYALGIENARGINRPAPGKFISERKN